MMRKPTLNSITGFVTDLTRSLERHLGSQLAGFALDAPM
jgi:hypothetical protein